MKRRTVLAQVGTLGAIGLAGCVSGGDDGAAPGTDTDEETASETETPTDTGTPTETDTGTEMPTDTPMTPTLDDTTIEVQHSDCGQQASDASVAFDDEAVVVTGTIWAPNPGYTATLADVNHDPETDELTVTVGIEGSDDDGPVVQCIAEIRYRATARFASGLPGTVTVVHETNAGTETVATVQRG